MSTQFVRLFADIDPQTIWLIVIVVALVGLLVVMPIFTNKARAKNVANLHSSLKVGDKIMTIGGIIGTIIAIRDLSPVDRELLIETGEGDNKTTLLLDIKALYQVIPPVGSVQTDPAAANADAADVFGESESVPVMAAVIPDESADPAPEAKPEASAEKEPVKAEKAPSAAKKPAGYKPVSKSGAGKSGAAKSGTKTGTGSKTAKK